ncbi:MAG: hypothetical protein EPN43_01520, partial [Jatrophihabitans sp.]
MARRNPGRPGGRFAKSGHTSHAPRIPPPPGAPAGPPPGPTGPATPPQDGFGAPTYHGHAPAGGGWEPPERSRSAGLTRAALSQTNRAARAVTAKVIRASKADGAHESGLTALIWNQV